MFDPSKKVFIITDASLTGVGGISLQEHLSRKNKLVPISFFSKSFTVTQSKYTVLERELLGILLALSNNYLLLSNEIVVYTDHQALVSISQKHSMLDKRILKFLETLSTYPVVIKYLPGKKNHADFLSRFCVDKQPELKFVV